MEQGIHYGYPLRETGKEPISGYKEEHKQWETLR